MFLKFTCTSNAICILDHCCCIKFIVSEAFLKAIDPDVHEAREQLAHPG